MGGQAALVQHIQRHRAGSRTGYLHLLNHVVHEIIEDVPGIGCHLIQLRNHPINPKRLFRWSRNS